MSFDDLDDGFKHIIDKADRIVEAEELSEERSKLLNELREKDAELKVQIEDIRAEIHCRTANIDQLQSLLSEHVQYFKLLQAYSGVELKQKLEQEIEGYDFGIYSKIYDDYYDLSGELTIPELKDQLDQKIEELDRLEMERYRLVQNAISILKDIDQNIENI